MAAKKHPSRVLVAKEELDKMTKEDLQKCWLRQEQYIDNLETKLNASNEQSEIAMLRESEEKLKQQQLDATRRENILVMRLTTKEQEMQEYVSQIQELKQAQIPSVAQLRMALLDPAVNFLFERMRKEMDSLKARLEETQNELSAWKFTPDSNTGKRLMAKCRLLYQENEELGKMISSGRMAKLEGDLALQKSFSEEMKKSQSELDEFLLELDEDVEGMQSTIYYLQQQLRDAKEQVVQLQKEKQKFTGLPNGSPTNHKSPALENEMEVDNYSSPKPLKGKEKPICISPSLVLNEVNGALIISSHKEVNSHKSRTPPPQTKESKPQITNEQTKHIGEESLTKGAEGVKKSNKEPTTPRESNVQSVIVENILNKCDGEFPTVKRTSVLVDGLGCSKAAGALRTDDLMSDKKPSPEREKKLLEETAQSQTSPPTKRTSESSRGRKRTRLRAPVEVKEEIVPKRKRLRRGEVVSLPEKTTEEKRTVSLEIDTDTEVQVAQTLAYWASAKQERKELGSESKESVVSAVGNGEIKSKISSEDK